MTMELCWEVKQNGKFCKNYTLTHKDKCHVHYDYSQDQRCVVYKFFILFMFSVFTYMMYVENKDFMDDKVNLTMNVFREYILQLYKNDKNTLYIYKQTAMLFISKFVRLLN